MKTIEERAKAAWNEYEYRDGELYSSCFTDGFIEGAKSEREELLRWHDPKDNLPGSGKIVLIKVRYTADGFVDYRIGTTISGKLCIAGRHEDCEIIGWGYIHEL